MVRCPKQSRKVIPARKWQAYTDASCFMRVRLTSWAVREAGVPTRSPGTHQLARIAVQVMFAKRCLDDDTSGHGYPGWHSGRFVGTREGVPRWSFKTSRATAQSPELHIGRAAGLVRTAFNQATDAPAPSLLYLRAQGCGVEVVGSRPREGGLYPAYGGCGAIGVGRGVPSTVIPGLVPGTHRATAGCVIVGHETGRTWSRRYMYQRPEPVVGWVLGTRPRMTVKDVAPLRPYLYLRATRLRG